MQLIRRLLSIRNRTFPCDVTYGIIQVDFLGKLEIFPGKPKRLSRYIVMYCRPSFGKRPKKAQHLQIDARWVQRLLQSINVYDSHTPRWWCNLLVGSRQGWLHETQFIKESKRDFSRPSCCPPISEPKSSMFFTPVSVNCPNADLIYTFALHFFKHNFKNFVFVVPCIVIICQ